jgi:hypothetical protein
MFSTSMPAMDLSISTARNCDVPPEVADVNCPGRAFASAISSFTFFTGREGCTTSTVCVSASWLTIVKSLIESNGSFAKSVGFTACGVVAISTVYPSGAARATTSVPMFVDAPARLSTMMLCPMMAWSLGARSRARMSVPPPGTAGTTMRTGLEG